MYFSLVCLVGNAGFIRDINFCPCEKKKNDACCGREYLRDQTSFFAIKQHYYC
jgi:hypothetical protein